MHTLVKKLGYDCTLIRAIILTKFQQCNVVRMVWEVLVDNHFADPDMFPVESDEGKKVDLSDIQNDTLSKILLK